MTRRGLLSSAVCGAVLLVLGCTAPPVETPKPTRTPTPTSTPTPQFDTSSYPSTRPVVAVPDVRPPGVVEPPPGRGLGRYLTQRLRWSPCPGHPLSECAWALAPLDYEKPDGAAVTLRLRRVAARDRPRLGTLFINPGGPGGSGVEAAGYLNRDGLWQYDIVGWDPRGAGESAPVRCDPDSLTKYVDADQSPDTQAELETLSKLAADLGESCLQKSGPLLAHVSTQDTVRDLDLLRTVLGDDKLHYLGVSYGTGLGSLYASMYPERVGRMVLDAAVDLDNPDAPSIPATERQFRRVVESCVALGECRLGTDVVGTLRRTREMLDAVDDRPLTDADPPLTQWLVALGIRHGLNDSSGGWLRLIVALQTALDDHVGAGLSELSNEALDRQVDGRLPAHVASNIAITCADHDLGGLAERLAAAQKEAAASPILGPEFALDITCSHWPVPTKGRPAIGAVVSPMLVIGTDGDPITPSEEAQKLAKKFPGAVFLDHHGTAHIAHWQSTCVREHVARYLTSGAVPAAGTRCDP